MDAAEKRRSIFVGMFILFGVALFIVGILTLGGSQKTFVKSIQISSIFSDVAGLKKGNNVWFSGVKVGTIKNVHFIGTSQVDVVMSIDASTQQYIHKNSAVRISSDGLIGNKIIVIDGGSPSAPTVQDGDVLQSEKLLSTDDIMKTLQQNNQNLLSITSDFKTLGHQILAGKGTVGALLADSGMAMQLRAAMRNLEATTASASRMATQLNAFSGKMNTKGGLADKLLTDTVAFNRIQESVTKLKEAANNATILTDNLNKASNKLNSTDNIMGVLLNDPKGAVKVQNTIDQLQQSSVKLNDDLEAVQSNFLLRGFFKKRDKAKQDSLKRIGKQ
jgi:phospholipid/cholesterol/gamma-HCH transport system substrate-binding protein